MREKIREIHCKGTEVPSKNAGKQREISCRIGKFRLSGKFRFSRARQISRELPANFPRLETADPFQRKPLQRIFPDFFFW